MNSEIKIPSPDNPCNLDCKLGLEKMYYTCFPGHYQDYFCRMKNSAYSVYVTTPYGVSSSHDTNYVSSTVTVTLYKNSTVTWTNADDKPNSVVSDNGMFDSGLIKPNQTWTYAFNNVGVYSYHSNQYSWLHGKVIVQPPDPNFRQGMPIENYGGNPAIDRFIFRETDKLASIKQISIIDNDTISLDLQQNGIEKTKLLKINDFIEVSCTVNGNLSNAHYLVFEEIDPVNKAVEFRDEIYARPGVQCNSMN
jgi:hypothetical protein